jgi:hypothetical protein
VNAGFVLAVTIRPVEAGQTGVQSGLRDFIAERNVLHFEMKDGPKNM